MGSDESGNVHQEQFPTDYILQKTGSPKVPWVALVVVALLVSGGVAWFLLSG